MGTFLTITSESRYAGSFENNVKQIKVVDYISDNLRNMAWQESISNQLQKEDRHHTSIAIFLRLFHIDDIEAGKLKSYARYQKVKERLVVDQMHVLNEYLDLPENEMINKLCDDILVYLKELLIKYKDRFQDFDAIAFIPLLEEQIQKIKNQEFEDNFYETELFATLQRTEEIKRDLNLL